MHAVAGKPPILLEGLIDDLSLVEALYGSCAPYTPLGGWFRPDQEGGEARSPMWFQGDWVHADFAAPGADLFFRNERVTRAARTFTGADVIRTNSSRGVDFSLSVSGEVRF